jgi:predicted component of type VI protein secretion system
MGMQKPFNWHEPHGTSGPHAPDALPRVALEIVRGRAREKFRRVESRTYLIGSAVDCDLVLADAQFADVHAYLLRDPRGAFARWLGCPPDLTVNGRPADAPIRLADGDCVRTGPYEFKVHIHWRDGTGAEEASAASLRLYIEPRKPPQRAPDAPAPAAERTAPRQPSVGLDLQQSQKAWPQIAVRSQQEPQAS